MTHEWDDPSPQLSEIVLAGKQRLAAGSPLTSLELDAYALWWRDLSYVVEVYKAGCAALVDELPGFQCAAGVGDSVKWNDPDECRRAVACSHAAALCTSLADFVSVFANDALSQSAEVLERVRERYAPLLPPAVAVERAHAELDPTTADDPHAWLEALELVFACGLPDVVARALADLLDHREQLAHLTSRTACPAPSFERMESWSLAAQAVGALVVLSLSVEREKRPSSPFAHPHRDSI